VGRQVINLSRDMVDLPSNLTLVKIKPERVTISAYQLYPREIKVSADTVGRLPEGYELRGVTVEPESIAVLAPSSLAGSRISLSTEPIDLTEVRASQSFTSKVIPSTSRVRFRDKEWPQVKVTVTVEEIDEDRGKMKRGKG
jgi:YbbR domain-containing protein